MTEKHSVFTRHLFRSGCSCATKLYYKANSSSYPEREEERPYIHHVNYNRQQLKGLLKMLYPEGVAVEQDGYEASSSRTARYLQKSHTVLFDGTFLADGLFAKVPLIEKDGNRITAFSIQTKAFDPDRHSITDAAGNIHSKWKDYLLEFAYQLFVMKRCYPQWDPEPYLLLPDKTEEARIDHIDRLVAGEETVKKGDISNLLVFIPVQNHIKSIWEGREPLFEFEQHPLRENSFEESLKTMARWYAEREKVFSGIGKKCRNCEFRVKSGNLRDGKKSGFLECWANVLTETVHKEHVFDLIGAGNGRLVKQEIYLQENVPLKKKPGLKKVDGSISDRQRRGLQIAKAKGWDVPGKLVSPRLLEEIDRWEYPLHFLDFEAGSYAVPFRAGQKPYHLVVFQFSCHTLQSDGSLEHYEWLHSGEESYPNFDFVRALKLVPGILDGTIVQYSGFERSALKKIRRELEEDSGEMQNIDKLLEWLRRIIRREDSNGSTAPYLADMGRLVKNYYYNRHMDGSLSIKDVLRSTMEISPVLEERFSRPYHGSNFDNIIWWQRQEGRVRNPYEILREYREVPVGRGTEAMVAYARLRSEDYERSERKELRSGLLSYCELDTLAMVMIYLHWRELAEN